MSIVQGERDPNSGDVDRLIDGELPTESDAPDDNFFFNEGSDGGRLVIDLGKPIQIKEINTYSWHPNTRGPQFYKLYASDAAVADFNARPRASIPKKPDGNSSPRSTRGRERRMDLSRTTTI